MTAIMFWNTAKKSVSEEIGALCRINNIDLFILAENKSDSSDIISKANNNGLYKFKEFTVLNKHIRLFSRLPKKRVIVLADVSRASIVHIKPIIGKNILVTGVHLTSKLFYRVEDQKLQVVGLMRNIREQQAKVKHENSLIIGDMNMNPFEDPMIASDGFHAVMTKDIANQEGRKVQNTHYKYLYNPMWNFLGDESQGPAGTFFRDPSGVSCYIWNMFDQVLISPSLLENYSKENLSIVTNIGGKSLIKDSKIDTSISDHLPIVIKLNTVGAV